MSQNNRKPIERKITAPVTVESIAVQANAPVTVESIAEQLCYWSKQTTDKGEQILQNKPYNKREYGKPHRLYSNIDYKASGQTFTINNELRL